MHMIFIGHQPKRPELGVDRALADALDTAFVAQPIADQIADRAHAQTMMAREYFQLRTPGHRAVVVHDLNDDCRRL